MRNNPNVRGLANWGLVVVDMQNDFLAAQGYYAQRSKLNEQVRRGTLLIQKRNHLLSQPRAAPRGRFRYRAPPLSSIVAKICAVIRHARGRQIPIIYLKATYGRQFEAQPPFLRLEPDREHYPCKPSSWGAGFIEPIERMIAPGKITSNERVIEKHSFDGFCQTDLLPFLRERQVQSVVVLGVETHVCVLATAQSAAMNQFRTVILEDCTWTAKEKLGQAALTIFRDAFGSTARARELFA